MASGNHAKLYGLNQIGLRRRGFGEETISALKQVSLIMFRMSFKKDAIRKVKDEVPDCPECPSVLNSSRINAGICR